MSESGDVGVDEGEGEMEDGDKLCDLMKEM